MGARLTPCSRRDFIRKLKALGYDGPYPGGNHGGGTLMKYGADRVSYYYMVGFTTRGSRVRVITARPASRKERRIYGEDR